MAYSCNAFYAIEMHFLHEDNPRGKGCKVGDVGEFKQAGTATGI